MQFCKPSQAVENNIGFVTCSPWLYPYTDTLHQPVKMGKKAGGMTQQIKTFFHMHQGVFMTTANFSDSDIKSHLNGTTK
jgi:hypothetical protein